ncbi:NADH-quinone oxidoreductase subunit B family protein [Cryobacterium psychrophilum]|uniref:Oxidoreductase n=1 Tax=Cryobacterium psychrophilum TaxID=41988 RepID=A0A4Y8KNG0_9MICO|nr:oxidoreductase [Cryobacterium psychrophilum]TDW29056.1 Ni,Fe-hydrogenase III small subunit [Cryobacterium psychrophilum]TFD79731.1 oxidoreductase [Cryobacterium psychrophilum]
MSVLRLATLIRQGGRIAERAPVAPPLFPGAEVFGGSIQVRFINAGGCNDCPPELSAAFGPVYDVERYGVRLTPSPRHADVLVITGGVTRNMAEPLRRTIDATPTPRFVIAVGDCAITGGIFAKGHGMAGPVSEFVHVDISVPGSPPSPHDIVLALRRMTGR